MSIDSPAGTIVYPKCNQLLNPQLPHWPVYLIRSPDASGLPPLRAVIDAITSLFGWVLHLTAAGLQWRLLQRNSGRQEALLLWNSSRRSVCARVLCIGDRQWLLVTTLVVALLYPTHSSSMSYGCCACVPT